MTGMATRGLTTTQAMCSKSINLVTTQRTVVLDTQRCSQSQPNCYPRSQLHPPNEDQKKTQVEQLARLQTPFSYIMVNKQPFDCGSA